MVTPANVLVVEDEPIVALDLERRLEQLGHSVPGVYARGEDVIDAVDEQQPDLILMDIRLAGNIDGIETARRIREHYDLPVIYLTAYADDETLFRARDTGPAAYLVKPVQDRELRSMIEIAIYKHHLEGELKNTNTSLSQRLRELAALNQTFQAFVTQQLEVLETYQDVLNGLRDLPAGDAEKVRRALALDLPKMPIGSPGSGADVSEQ